MILTIYLNVSSKYVTLRGCGVFCLCWVLLILRVFLRVVFLGRVISSFSFVLAVTRLLFVQGVLLDLLDGVRASRSSFSFFWDAGPSLFLECATAVGLGFSQNGY